MSRAGKNRLVLIAEALLMASALLVLIPIDVSSAAFSAGVLTGTATLLLTLRWTLFK